MSQADRLRRRLARQKRRHGEKRKRLRALTKSIENLVAQIAATRAKLKQAEQFQFPVMSLEFFGKCQCVQGTAECHMITLHQTQGDTARGGAITLTTRTDGSAHEVLDSKEGFVLARDYAVLCHVAGANTGNYGIEMAGFSSWDKLTWFLPRNRFMMRWAAFRLAKRLRKIGSPNKFYTVAMLNSAPSLAAVNGWTTHNNLSLSNKSESTHTDPGALFPMTWFKKRVAEAYEWLEE